MKITNNLGLPQPLVDAVTFDDYSKGFSDFTASQLSQPGLMLRLKRDHADEITEDAADRIWMLFGTAIHAILERAGHARSTTYNIEDRMYGNFGGFMVGGKQDVYEIETRRICDWKVTSAWSVRDGNPKPEWELQLNTLALIHRQNDIPVNGLEVVAILRDWGPRMKFQGVPNPIVRVPVPLWPEQEIWKQVKARCEELQAALDSPTPEDIPECTDEEIWLRGESWAVMSEGRKSSHKNHDTEAQALNHCEELTEKESKKKKGKKRTFFVEHRPGVRQRCEEYCSVAPYCWAHKKAMGS